MSKAQWIWYNGDFELYHSMKLHSRREEFGVEYPCFWSLSAPYPTASFAKAYHSDGEDTVRVVTRHKAYVTIDGRRLPVNQRRRKVRRMPLESPCCTFACNIGG